MKSAVLAAVFAAGSLLSVPAASADKDINTQVNFAFGGARTDMGNATGIFDPALAGAVGAAGLQLVGLTQQLDQAAATLVDIKPNRDLFYLSAGTNDFLSGLVLNDLDPGVSAGRIAGALDTLYGMGARYFVVPNLAPVGNLPLLGLFGLDADQRAGLNFLTSVFNAILAGQVAQFEATHPGAYVVLVDVEGIVNGLATNPNFFDTSTPCIFTGAPACDGFLFLDLVHPTEEVYALYAQAAYDGLVDVILTDDNPDNDEDVNGRLFRRTITLGDSLADTGAYSDVVFRATGTPGNPTPPYFQGRFSDGLSVIDYLEDLMNVKYPSEFYPQPAN